jgi:cell division protein FtsL
MINITQKGALIWNIKKLVSKGDYYYAVVPNHPNATKRGYVLAHRVIMENHLGRLLDKNEVVHHIDENKKNNDINNLQLMKASEHASHHAQQKGETMLEMKCPHCNIVFSRPRNKTHIGKKQGKTTFCSASCRGKFWRDAQLGRLTTNQVESAISVNILREYNSLDNTEGTHLQETP